MCLTACFDDIIPPLPPRCMGPLLVFRRSGSINTHQTRLYRYYARIKCTWPMTHYTSQSVQHPSMMSSINCLNSQCIQWSWSEGSVSSPLLYKDTFDSCLSLSPHPHPLLYFRVNVSMVHLFNIPHYYHTHI